MSATALAPEQLRLNIAPDSLGFASTAELQDQRAIGRIQRTRDERDVGSQAGSVAQEARGAHNAGRMQGEPPRLSWRLPSLLISQ